MAPASGKPKDRWLWILARARHARVADEKLVGAAIASQHPKRLHVGFQDGFLFGPLVGVLLAQAHDGAQRLDVEAVALGLRIDVADVVRDRLLFFFQPLDALDDGLELVFCKFGRGRFLDRSRGGHRVLLNGTGVEVVTRLRSHAAHLEMTLKIGAPRVKATSRSSTARPQEKNVLRLSLRADGSRLITG